MLAPDDMVEDCRKEKFVPEKRTRWECLDRDDCRLGVLEVTLVQTASSKELKAGRVVCRLIYGRDTTDFSSDEGDYLWRFRLAIIESRLRPL